MSNTGDDSIRAPIVAILLFEVCTLFARSYLQIRFAEAGFARQHAADLAYLFTAPIFVALIWPVLRRHRRFLADRLAFRLMSWKLLGTAFLVGILLRVAYWGQLIAATSFGMVGHAGIQGRPGPFFAFDCPPATSILLYVMVMAGLVPLIEEIVNRGFLLHTLVVRGRTAAIVGSSLLFAVFHPPAGIPQAFAAGVILAAYALRTRSLLPGIVAHATFNGLIVLDWYCLAGTSNPAWHAGPLPVLGLISSLACLVALSAAVSLIRRAAPGHNPRPGTDPRWCKIKRR